MAINYNYAIKYSTSKIVSRAYREYATETAEAYGRLVGMVSQAVEYDNDQNKTRSVDDAINEILTTYGEYGYSINSPVILPAGATTLGDLLRGMIQNNVNMDSAIDQEQEHVELTLPLMSERGTVEKSITDILTDMQNCFHAAVVDQGAAIAFDNGGSPSEMVSMLRDSVMSVFSNGYTDYSNTLNSTIDKIKSGVSIVDYVEEKLYSSGIYASAETGATFDQSQDYTFTGSSVASAQSWKSAATKTASAIGQAVRVAAQAVVGTVKGILKLGKKLFKKAVSKLRQLFVDPYDIEEINGELGNHTVNGFQFQDKINLSTAANSSLIEKLMKGPIHLDFIPCEMILQIDPESIPVSTANTGAPTWSLPDFLKYVYDGPDTFDALFFKLIEQLYPDDDIQQISDHDYVYILNTLTGHDINELTALLLATIVEAQIDGFTDVEAQQLSELPNWNLVNLLAYTYNVITAAPEPDPEPEPVVDVVANCLIKLKPIHWSSCVSLLQTYATKTVNAMNEITNTYTLGSYIDTFERIKLEDGMYTNISRNERDLYRDFLISLDLAGAMFMILSYEAQGASDETIRAVPYRTHHEVTLDDLFDNVYPDGVTNEHFFNLFTKFESPVVMQAPGNIPANAAQMLTAVFDYRKENPFDYEFFPYSQDYADWFMPSFELKSDQLNENAFVDFVSKAVIVVIVATIATTAVVTLRKLAMKANIKQKAAELVASDKAIVGRIDKNDLKRLKKATRRAKTLNALTGGLTSTATQVGINDIFGSDVEHIVTLIRG